MRSFYLSLVLAVFAIGPAGAQVTDSTTRYIDRWVDEADISEGGGERTTEHIENLRARPLDINTATRSDVASLPEVTLLLAGRIVRYRRTHGAFSSPLDITQVEGVDTGLYRRVRPFITCSVASPTAESHTPDKTQPWSQALKHLELRASYRWKRRLDLGRGYQTDTTRTTFVGGPVRHVTRLDVRLGDRLRAASALDKDSGEAWRWSPNTGAPGFDHISGTLALDHLGPLDALIVGDYTVSAGHGVAVWRGMSFGKGRDPFGGVLRSGRGIAPFASTEENRFFRGIALQVATAHRENRTGSWRPDVSFSPFVSRRRLDASRALSPEGDPGWSTLTAGGLHRTRSEIATRDAVRETVGGAMIEISRGRWMIGGVALTSELDESPLPPDRPDEAFDATHRRTAVGSVYATIDAGPSVLTGEVARGPSGSTAAVAGWAYDDGKRVEVLAHGRYYDRGYDNRYASAFSETSTRNEIGLYSAVRLHVQKSWTVAGYIDQYRFPWLRYNIPRPTDGRDVRLVVEHEPRDWLSHYVEFRSETKEQRAQPSLGRSPLATETVAPELRQSVRWDATYKWSEKLEFGTRIETVRMRTDPTQDWHHGVLLFQEATWQPVSRLQLTGRLTLFDTDGFQARVFAYESGPRYAFSVPALFGRGERSYVLLRVDLFGGASLEAKYGVTRYDDRRRVGSGLAEVSKNRVRALDVQLHWTLH
ncbi:hypothetical protein CRI94_02605 [Longibacter salinarum]|uniref:Helix-hairpin-helix domain-containing protein n=1 Tax=Longibacter salinarum TaxID=1850348 RepID=A0A2A8D2T7_9BACT|nr:helix-hairpin-helix domain-containing protein [Longibacter salinarum]PEN15191.1 hypothetical protein CRI94_02605 [Longibacter salinarum]